MIVECRQFDCRAAMGCLRDIITVLLIAFRLHRKLRDNTAPLKCFGASPERHWVIESTAIIPRIPGTRTDGADLELGFIQSSATQVAGASTPSTRRRVAVHAGDGGGD